MSIRFLLDECLRDRRLWNAIQNHNRDNPEESVEVIRVGDESAPAAGTLDSEVVEWAANHGWMILSNDANTLRRVHDEYVQDGHSTCGLLLKRPGFPIAAIVECLVLIAYDSTAEEWNNRTEFIPF